MNIINQILEQALKNVNEDIDYKVRNIKIHHETIRNLEKSLTQLNLDKEEIINQLNKLSVESWVD